MTTPQLIVTALSGAAAFGCVVSGSILLAEWSAKLASRRWWRDRDPEWRDPISAGASVAHAGCSAPSSFGASHPAAPTQPKGDSKAPGRTPAGFISQLTAGGSLRRVA